MFEVRFNASEEFIRQLEQLKGLMSRAYPGASMGELFEILVKEKLDKLDLAKHASNQEKQDSPHSEQRTVTSNPLPTSEVVGRKSIPIALKRAVWRRDQSRCSFIDPKSGRMCLSTFKLEIDHRVPIAKGGRNEMSNLRLYCRHHNAWAAANQYGLEKIQKYWKSA
jgi:hypothetical protein